MPTDKNTFAFGDAVAQFRTRSYKSLREFCLKNHFDPILVSKWERGLAPPPAEDEVDYLAKCLGLKEGSAEFEKLVSLAQEARDHYTPKEVSEEEIFEKLPVAFRGLRVDEDPEDVIKEFRNIAKKVHDSEK